MCQYSGRVSLESKNCDLDFTPGKVSDTESEYQLSETSEDRAFVVSDTEQLSFASSSASQDPEWSSALLNCGKIASSVSTSMNSL
jgi:hypothetical protein